MEDGKQYQVIRDHIVNPKQNDEENLDIKIVQKEDIQLVGISIPTSFKMGQSKKDIPPIFHKTLHDGTLDKVPNRINQNLMCFF